MKLCTEIRILLKNLVWQSNDFVGCCKTDYYLDCVRNARSEIVPSTVNQPVLVIPKFFAIISVYAGPLRPISGCCKHHNGKVDYAVLMNPFKVLMENLHS